MKALKILTMIVVLALFAISCAAEVANAGDDPTPQPNLSVDGDTAKITNLDNLVTGNALILKHATTGEYHEFTVIDTDGGTSVLEGDTNGLEGVYSLFAIVFSDKYIFGAIANVPPPTGCPRPGPC